MTVAFGATLLDCSSFFASSGLLIDFRGERNVEGVSRLSWWSLDSVVCRTRLHGRTIHDWKSDFVTESEIAGHGKL